MLSVTVFVKLTDKIKRPTILEIRSVAFAMLLLASWVVLKAIPSSETARLRNALIAQVGNQDDFEWPPSAVPTSFHQENIHVSTDFSNYLSRKLGPISTSSQLKKSLSIANFLLVHDDPNAEAIMSNTNEALRSIVESGYGYCADFTQVFNGAAYLNGIPVREWGISFDGFGGKGHAINEIYDNKLKQWILIDVFNAFYLVDNISNVPLSVMDFQNLMRANSPEAVGNYITVKKIKYNRFGFRDDTALFEYFARGQDHFYLWWGNDSLTYDNNPYVSFASKISRHTEQLVAIALGVHQQIRILPNEQNMQDIRALIYLRTQLIYAFQTEIILGIFLILRYTQLVVSRKE